MVARILLQSEYLQVSPAVAAHEGVAAQLRREGVVTPKVAQSRQQLPAAVRTAHDMHDIHTLGA